MQMCNGIIHIAGVDIDQPDSQFFSMFRSEKAGSSGKPVVINISNHQQSWFPLLMQRIIDGSKSHGTNTGKKSHLPTLFNTHIMYICSGGDMITCMKCSYNT